MQEIVPPKPNLVGMMVGSRYYIEQELGRGGFGVVYLARDKPELMSRRVVVKVLLEDSLKDKWVVQKFHQEIEALARLDDPGVVGIFDAGSLPDGAPYLVMQFVDGVSLRSEIKPGGMDFQRAANIIRQVGRTLAEAHDKGIIHRDLKPENIMLRSVASGEEQVKVIDFGIAKVKNSVIAPSTITGAGVAGTIGYMPPEQLAAQKVTPASDVYALGVIVYEILTGIRPFNPETAFQLLEMQREGVRVKPKDLRPALSEAAQQMILKALAFEPEDRYQRARDFSEALARALLDESKMLEASTLSLRKDNAVLPGKEQMPSSAATQESPTLVDSSPVDTMDLAHVLFTDIVGYSNLPIDLQTKAVSRLREVVRGTTEVTRAPANKQLIRLPTGDGMALVFFGDPQAPVRCALEISKALKSHPEIQLRMGAHSGPVSHIVDVNESLNVAGDGINMAQRVMDCGDAGHILLSKRIAGDLGQYSSWRPYLHDLGEVEVKHGVRMHIVNLFTDELGNPELPQKFKKRKKAGFAFPALMAILLVAAIIIALLLWKPWGRKATKIDNVNSNVSVPPPPAERVFTYFLTPSDRGKSVEEERFTGNEQFRNGSKFRFVLIPEQPGSLYLLDRGAGANGTESWNVLFPTPKNNSGFSQLVANQRMEARISFDMYPGNENLSIIWSTRPVPELENIFKDAAKTDFEIKDPAQIATIRDFLAKYGSSEPKAEVEPGKNQTTVKGSSDIFIRKLVLKHFEF
jgi:serine/threonine protein kinase